MKRSAVVTASCVVLLAGCGGGGGGPVAQGGGQEISLGSIQVRSQSGSLKPLTVGGNGPISFFTLSGATLAHVAYSPSRTLGNTRIAFGIAGGNVWTVDPSGGHLFQVTNGTDIATVPSPSWSPDNLRLIYGVNPSGGVTFNYYVVGASGYGSVLQSYSGWSAQPHWSPTSNTILYYASDGTHNQLYSDTVNSSATPTQLSVANYDYKDPAWSPDGSKIAFQNSFDNNIWWIYGNGAGIPQRLTSAGNMNTPAWSPDGTRLAVMYFDSQKGYEIGVFNLSSGSFGIVAGDVYNTNPTWSPDSRQIAYLHSSDGGNIYDQLMVVSADGTFGPNLVFQSPHTLRLGAPSWSNYPITRTMIGTGGLFGTSTKAGLIFSQDGDMVQSFLTFNASNPATVTVVPGSASATNQSFNISGGGGISALSYANDLLLAPIAVVPTSSFPTAAGVIVSMNVNDGHISLTLPYAKLSSKVVSKSGGTIYSGQILGVFDGSGKNLAPNGATSVEISSVGKVVSAH